MGTINIVRIPDGIDPDWVVDHLLLNEDLSTKPFLGESSLATIHYDYFNGKQSPLNMSWDGRIEVSNIFTEDATSFPATSGNYLVLPDFQYSTGHQVQFKIDRDAIFHLDGLVAGINMTNYPNNNVSVALTLTPPPGTVGNITAELHSNLLYPEISGPSVGNITNIRWNHFHNETVVLVTAAQSITTIVFDVKVPDNGETSQTVFFDALLVTPSGNCTFGFNGNWWNGQWLGINQY